MTCTPSRVPRRHLAPQKSESAPKNTPKTPILRKISKNHFPPLMTCTTKTLNFDFLGFTPQHSLRSDFCPPIRRSNDSAYDDHNARHDQVQMMMIKVNFLDDDACVSSIDVECQRCCRGLPAQIRNQFSWNYWLWFSCTFPVYRCARSIAEVCI